MLLCAQSHTIQHSPARSTRSTFIDHALEELEAQGSGCDMPNALAIAVSATCCRKPAECTQASADYRRTRHMAITCRFRAQQTVSIRSSCHGCVCWHHKCDGCKYAGICNTLLILHCKLGGSVRTASQMRFVVLSCSYMPPLHSARIIL